MNFKAMALLLIMMFAGGLAVSQEMGLMTITAYTTETTYPGDVVSITYSDYITNPCPDYKLHRIELKVIGAGGYSQVLSGFEGSTFTSGELYLNQIKATLGSWVVPTDLTYPHHFTAVGRVVCSDGSVATNGWIDYSFEIQPKPIEITCTNECNLLGARDVTYGECPYRVCGRYDADVCLEWSAPISDGTCIIDDPEPPVGDECPTDVKQCPDGSYVSRNIDNDCNFDLCPVQVCESIWKTGVWSDCRADGFQTRQVFDLNNCAEPTGVMPQNKQTCTPDDDIVDPVCGTFKPISESDCIEGQKLIYYENACGEETENLEPCTSEEFFDQKTIIMIVLVLAAVSVVGWLLYKRK